MDGAYIGGVEGEGDRDNLNECVKPNDKLYILGDISHHIAPEESNTLIKRIHGKKYLLLGNHDVTGDPEVCRYNTNLFQWVGPYLKMNSYGLNVIMMHYPMLTWPKVMAGSVMLHGHIHSGPEYNEANRKAGIRRYDVGVDANNYYPVSIDQIKSWAAETPVTITPRTNLYMPGLWKQEPVSLEQYESEHPDRKLIVTDSRDGNLEMADYQNDQELLRRPVLDAHAIKDGYPCVAEV